MRGGACHQPTGFVDAWALTSHDECGGAPAEVDERPVPSGYRFVSAELKDHLNSVEVGVDAQGSDHQPV